MTTFANALKDEIRRIARKEIRAQTGKQAHRREIAVKLRGSSAQQREQEKKIGYLEAHSRDKRSTSTVDSENEQRFSARSVKANVAALVSLPRITPSSSEFRRSRSTTGSTISRDRAKNSSLPWSATSRPRKTRSDGATGGSYERREEAWSETRSPQKQIAP